ncbi:MAG: hypothetical protein AAB447_01940 [Patescibacteria group bacterium]
MKKLILLVATFLLTAGLVQADLLVGGSAMPATVAVRRAIIPMINITFTNTVSEWITPTIQIQRIGSVPNDNFGRIVLLRDDGLLGFWGTPFDLNHQARVSGYPVGNSGGNSASRTWTIAILMSDDVSEYVGKTVGLNVISIGTDATVSGILPIQSALHTVSELDLCGDLKIRSSSLLVDANVSIGTPSQVLGGFDLVVSPAERISIPFLDVGIESDFGEVSKITNLYIVDEQNTVLAGPVDVNTGELISGKVGTAYFNDTITLNPGTNRLLIKGNIGSSFFNMGKIRLNIDPAPLQPQGQTYGWKFLSTQRGPVFSSTMTARGPALRIRPDPAFQPQRVFGGRAGVVMGQFILDASQSSEDVRVPVLQLSLSVSNVYPLHLTNCRLFDGATAVTSSANLVNPSAPGVVTFTLDGSGLVVPKGTTKTLTLKTITMWGIDIGSVSWSATSPQQYLGVGVISANAASLTVDTSALISETRPANWSEGKILWVKDIGPGDPLWVGAGPSTVASVEFDCDPARRYKIQVTTDLRVWRDAISGAGFMPTDASGKIGCYTYFTRTNGLTNVFRAVAE